jgi:hypothetical protein
LVVAVTADRIVIGDNDVRAQESYLINHAAQGFVMIPDAEGFVRRF